MGRDKPVSKKSEHSREWLYSLVNDFKSLNKNQQVLAFLVLKHGLDDQTIQELKSHLLEIRLSLDACHGCVTTDLPEVEPDDNSWRIDNDRAIKCVDDLAEKIGIKIINNPE